MDEETAQTVSSSAWSTQISEDLRQIMHQTCLTTVHPSRGYWRSSLANPSQADRVKHHLKWSHPRVPLREEDEDRVDHQPECHLRPRRSVEHGAAPACDQSRGACSDTGTRAIDCSGWRIVIGGTPMP
jgi:hypothetical protein